MKYALVLAATVLLAACVSSPGGQSNLHDAARINTQLGIDYMRNGKTDLALDKLRRALEQDDDYAQAHAAIAYVYQTQGETKLADKHYRRAASLDGNDPSLMNNYAVFLCGQGKAWEADRYFQDAINHKHYTTPEIAWINAGLCAKTYDPVKGERYFREALRIKPAMPEALLQMAKIEIQRKDFLRARGFMQRYEQAAQHGAESLSLAAQAERELGDEIAARKYEARLKRDFPNSPEAANLQKNVSNDS